MALVLAVAALALVAFAGCGGDDDDSSPNDSGNAASTNAGATGETGGGGGSESGGAAGGGAAGGGSTVQISADPDGALAYEQSEVEAKAGSVEIDFTNEASIPHDVAVEQDGQELGKTDEITGSTTSTTVDLKPGEYTFFCTLPGHREAGMEGTLLVQ